MGLFALVCLLSIVYGSHTSSPTVTSVAPSVEPTAASSAEPTAAPSVETAAPSAEPTTAPSVETAAPSAEPTAAPSVETVAPSAEPTAAPSAEPTAAPSVGPTDAPSAEPTAAPSAEPTAAPSGEPTSSAPTVAPSSEPTSTTAPSQEPTASPSSEASFAPSSTPTSATAAPSSHNTSVPTASPSSQNTSAPSSKHTESPSSLATIKPTRVPTQGTMSPTSKSKEPTTNAPNTAPTHKTNEPTKGPSREPTTSVPSSGTSSPSKVSSAPTHAPTPAGPSSNLEATMSLNNFVKYPGYAGGLTSKGDVILSHHDTSVSISYNLQDVDPRCTQRNDTLANSCGLHIHSGFSCDTDSGVGGHYYNASVSSDPWAYGSFYVVEGNVSSGQVEVEYGYSIEETKGRVFVLHDFDGRRVSCAVLPATVDLVTLGKLGVYLNYTGALRVDGCITMHFRSTSVEIMYNLTGVDSRCANRSSTIANSCGLHIHAGLTCDAAGAHYFDPVAHPADPWANVSYVVQTQSMSAGVLDVEYGYGFDSSQGRSVVVHDFDGSRISCVSIPSRPKRVTAVLPPLAPYPGYNGTLNITGAITIDFAGNGVQLAFNLHGTEPNCPGSAANSCGIHIHSGYSCADAQGHFYNAQKYPVDPWAKVSYFSKNESSVNGFAMVSFGNDFFKSSGRVVVVHGHDGSRVACAVIPALTDRVVAVFAPSQNLTSTVQLDFRSTSVHMTYNLQGIDAKCSNKSSQDNSCTLQIFEGTCAALGNHYYQTATDPWLKNYYIAVGQMAMGSLDVEYGYGFDTTQGRSLVITDEQGKQIGCVAIPKGGIRSEGGSTPTTSAGVADIRGEGISGQATVLFQGMGAMVKYELAGLDPRCAAPGSAINSCGIHIHRGFNCSMSETHFFDSASYPLDPWLHSVYTAVGTSGRSSLVVSFGEDWGATQGRTLVVHNYDGSKAACGSFPEATERVLVPSLTKFPQSNSTFSFVGGVTLDFRTTGVRVQYSFTNADTRCVGAQQAGVANSCGLHIHAGFSCENPAAAGPHFYAPSYPVDPWATAFYTSMPSGTAQGLLEVDFGYGYSQSKGRAVVAHDWDGNRVACALIPMEQGNTASVVVQVPQITRTPGYTGPYDLKFEDVSIEFKGGGSAISYKMSGVPCECERPGTKPNSCALHIQDGNSCSELANSTWYNHNLFAVDPWTPVQYIASPCSSTCQSAGNVTAEGSLVVSYGYDYSETRNKLLVVHDYFGAMMGCTVINAEVPDRELDSTGSLPVPNLHKYPGYEGNVNISGRLVLMHVKDTVKITYLLDGVEPACSSPAAGVLTSCSLSIHTGFSCNSDVEVGMDYYNSTGIAVDPWETAAAKYKSEGSSAVGSIQVEYGYSIDLTKGRVVVVTDFHGDRVACAVLPSTTDMVTLGKFASFPGVKNDVTGCVEMDFRGSSVGIKYDIAGVDPKCSTKGSAPNSCGLHIHSNKTCELALVGGHYYAGAQDPWSNVSYKAQAGRAQGNAQVEFGYGFDLAQGRAVVIHDYYGNKTNCVLLPSHQMREQAILPPLEPYPGYNGTNINGSVKLDFRGQGVKITYALSGVEPACSVPGTAPNSCGIHIHEGFSCESAGGHFYNKAMFATDPWATAPYVANGHVSMFSLIVSFGYDYAQSAGRTIVVHSYSGARVACAVIPALTDNVLISELKPFTNSSKASGSIALEFRASSVRINYNLTGLDPNCANPDNVTDSCGLHIHTGTSCASIAAIGGNLFLNGTADPWQSARIVGPACSGSFNVENGFGYAASQDRALVVHNRAGAPIACAIIPKGVLPRHTASVVSLQQTSAKTSGKFVLNFAGTAVRIGYDLSGVDSNCSMPGTSPLSCTLRIQRGFTCDAPEPDFYNGPLNPWTYATYSAQGDAAEGSFIVQNGENFDSTMGRSLVLYNYAGTRVGCSLIPETTQRVTAGMVQLDFRASSVRLNFNIWKGDTRCTMKDPQVNLSCGVRILSGTSCKRGQEGTDFYDAKSTTANPWLPSFYVYQGNESRGYVNVENGYNIQQTLNHALAIFDYEGKILNCTLIVPNVVADEQTIPDITFGAYPDYHGSYKLNVSSTSVQFSGDGATISYSLHGVPCECSEIGPAPNSCGLHIHDGASCETAAGIGGHWYQNVTADPWSFTPYIALPCSSSCSSGATSASGTLTVSFGYGAASSRSKVLVVHDYLGQRIGCAPILPQAKPAGGDAYLILPFLITIGALLVILVVGVFVQNRKKPDPMGTIHQALLSDSDRVPTQGKGRGMSVNEA